MGVVILIGLFHLPKNCIMLPAMFVPVLNAVILISPIIAASAPIAAVTVAGFVLLRM